MSYSRVSPHGRPTGLPRGLSQSFVRGTRSRRSRIRRGAARCIVAPFKSDHIATELGRSREAELHLAADPAPQDAKRFWLWERTRGLAHSFYSVFRLEQRQDEGLTLGTKTHTSLHAQTASQKLQDVKEQREDVPGSSATEAKNPALDIQHLLHKVGLMEIRYIRMLASLCSLTYIMPHLSERSLFRRHGLQLVTTSLVFERMVKDTPRTVFNAAEEADGMAASQQTVASAYNDMLRSAESPVPPSMQAIEELKRTDPLDHFPTPVEVVSARLALALGAMSHVAAPLTNNISWATSAAVGATVGSLQAIGAQLQAAASVGQSTALATLATVMAALDSAWNQKEVTPMQAVSSSYWFVADDAKAHTRFFVIQGSNNIDHWRINLQFDPVVFEDPSLGLKVHRGFYEAAKILYDQFLPLVEEHLASSQAFAKIVFTGHSLGGSVSTLLMLMFLHRRIIPPHALGPVYTFGAPAIFCETNPTYAEAAQAADKGGSESSRPDSISESVLDRLGLNTGAVRNVIMHRDIVPRAFACDYALVADLLATVHESFRNLECLRDAARQVMYYPLGRTLILQPDDSQKFVYGRTDHPMLPPGPNIYTLKPALAIEPATLKPQPFAAQGSRSDSHSVLNNIVGQRPHRSSVRHAAQQPEQRRTGSANLDSDGSNIDDSGPDRQGGAALGPRAKSVWEALAAFMDSPHPLDILGEPGSYGPWGAISRYHDPVNYTRALGGVLRARREPWKTSQQDLARPVQLPKVHSVSAVKSSRKTRNKDEQSLEPRELLAENLPGLN